MQSMKHPPVHFDDDDWGDDCPDRCEDKVPLGGYYHCPVCDREWLEEGDEGVESKEAKE